MVTSLSFFITLLVKYIASENFATRDTKKPAIMVKKTPSNVNFGKEYFEFFVGGITGQFFLENLSVPCLCGYFSVSVFFENSDLLSN